MFLGLWFLVVSGCVFAASQLVFDLVGRAVADRRVESCLIAGLVSIHEATKVDGLLPRVVHYSVDALVLQGGVEGSSPGARPAHSRAADGGEDLVVPRVPGEFLGGVLAAPAACGRS